MEAVAGGHRFRALGGAGLLAALAWSAWLWANPYPGIVHDARIYLVMAYRHLVPQAFERDVWFRFGAQDRFSVFDEIYALALARHPVETVAFWLGGLGGIVWVAGAVSISCAILGRSAALWAATLLCALAPAYTFVTSDVFVLTESFATARPFAMGLSLLGLAAWETGRRKTAVVTWSSGVALHPLMAGWAVVAVVAQRLSDRTLLAALLAGLVFLVAGIAFGIPSLQPMDVRWFELVAQTSGIVFAPDPQAVAVDRCLWWIGVLSLAGHLASSPYRRLYFVVAWLAAMGTWASVSLSFCLPSAWFAQVQPWRVLWLATAIGIVAAVDLWRCFGSLAIRYWARGALVGSYLAAGQGAGAFLCLAWLVMACPSARQRVGEVWQRHSAHARSAVSVALLAWIWSVGVLAALPLRTQTLKWSCPSSCSLEIPSIVPQILVPLLLACAASRGKAWSRWCVTFGVAIGMLLWDQRSPAQREVETLYRVATGAASSQWQPPPGSVVYWPENDLGPWLQWSTAGYAQSVQAIGIVFSRAHAVTLHDRLLRIRGLAEAGPIDASASPFNLHDASYYPARWTAAGLKALCVDRELDYVALSRTILAAPDAAPLPSHQSGPWKVYSCGALRSTSAPTTRSTGPQ